jgi:hypothetical protein
MQMPGCKHGAVLTPGLYCVICEAEARDARRGPYAELRRVLDLALDQAANGKGKERHALEGERFEDQQIVQLGAWMGSNHFELGQAVKKLLESARLKPGPAKREILGAINYAAAAVILLERAERAELAEAALSGPQQSEG